MGPGAAAVARGGEGVEERREYVFGCLEVAGGVADAVAVDAGEEVAVDAVQCGIGFGKIFRVMGGQDARAEVHEVREA